MKRIFFLLFFCILIMNISGQGKLTDSRDENTYKILIIDKVTWMVENLRYKAPVGAYYFDNDTSNNRIYGILYDWKTAVKVCPEGWHLPTGAEYQKLVNYYDLTGEWKKKQSDTVFFGAQLGGMQDYEGTFTEMDESAYFWTSTEYDKDHAEYLSYLVIIKIPVVDISRKDDIEDVHGTEKTNKYSVRCIKN